MPNPTDDPPRTKPLMPAVPDSRAVPSPAASPAVQTAGDHLLTQESFQAVLSAHQRAGRWEAADEIEVRAIFGAVTLDFTRAELPPSGVIEIDVLAFCGAVEIIVPDGAEVELDGTPVLGSIEQKLRKLGAREESAERVTAERDESLPTSPSASEPPYFRIDCRAILGSIEVMGR